MSAPAAAGTQPNRALLDRPLPEGYREEQTARFAEAHAAETGEAGEARTALLFRLGEEWLALPTAILQEVAEPRRAHPLPHRRDDRVLGVVNVRGELLICVDLVALLSLAVAEKRGDDRAFPRMLVIGRDGWRAAFQVDEVDGVLRYDDRDRVEAPATVKKSPQAVAAAMLAWNGRTVGLLDEALLLDALDRSIA